MAEKAELAASAEVTRLSFAASTLGGNPSGERFIGRPKNGDIVLADNPTTGKREPEAAQPAWRNHDHDLIDVRLIATATKDAAGEQDHNTPTSLGVPGCRHGLGLWSMAYMAYAICPLSVR